ncbi:MAG: TetR family transcriptional regulator C-terminal domain-containing protein, partial [Treponema sp.]|nr:TetR family transcriptional regulator C-terminal domain-containing protein [Treponema sp.]
GKAGSREATVVLQDMLQFIANNSNSIQVLLSEKGDSDFQKKFFRMGIERMSQVRESAGTKSRDKEADKYDFVFVIGGIFTLIQEGLKNDMDIPAPKMAKILFRLTRGVLD